MSDWASNAGSPQIQVALVLFRIAQTTRRSPSRLVRMISTIPAAMYRIFSVSVAGIDIPVDTNIGNRLTIHHGIGLVVHASTRIGNDVVLRHCTTLGAKNDADAPTIADRVDIGPNSVVLGQISLLEDVVVGAGSVVLRSVAAGDVVAGNPAKSLRVGREQAP
jgi:putative colanic acid biosynthesis acetyltransferase WcaB